MLSFTALNRSDGLQRGAWQFPCLLTSDVKMLERGFTDGESNLWGVGGGGMLIRFNKKKKGRNCMQRPFLKI